VAYRRRTSRSAARSPSAHRNCRAATNEVAANVDTVANRAQNSRPGAADELRAQRVGAIGDAFSVIQAATSLRVRAAQRPGLRIKFPPRIAHARALGYTTLANNSCGLLRRSARRPRVVVDAQVNPAANPKQAIEVKLSVAAAARSSSELDAGVAGAGDAQFRPTRSAPSCERAIGRPRERGASSTLLQAPRPVVAAGWPTAEQIAWAADVRFVDRDQSATLSRSARATRRVKALESSRQLRTSHHPTRKPLEMRVVAA